MIKSIDAKMYVVKYNTHSLFKKKKKLLGRGWNGILQLHEEHHKTL